MHWNYKARNDIFSLLVTSNEFIHAFCLSEIHFYKSGPLKFIKTMLKSFRVLLGLFPVWNFYPKGSHNTGATKRSMIAYDGIKDKICK